jgi:hypothetical protein
VEALECTGGTIDEPVLHRSTRAGTTTSWPPPEMEGVMYAQVGDRILVRSNHVGRAIRRGEVIEVEHDDGRPPYKVRWSDTGHESMFFPGSDAQVEHRSQPTYQPEYDASRLG